MPPPPLRAETGASLPIVSTSIQDKRSSPSTTVEENARTFFLANTTPRKAAASTLRSSPNGKNAAAYPSRRLPPASKSRYWHVQQIRRTAGTSLRHEYGLEAAQGILGQKTLTVTQVCPQKNVALAEKILAGVR